MNELKKTFLVLLMIATSCAAEEQVVPETPPDENPPPENPLAYPLTTIHFTFYYTLWDSASIVAIGDSLEVHYQRITTDLGAADLPKVNVHFYTSYDSLADAVKDVVPDLPSWAIGLATAEDEIHMLSPNDPNHDFQYMLTNVIHEFAHCVSLHMNATIGNNPRWLWESAAIFEAGQFVDPHNVTYLVNQDPPTIAELNSFSNTYVYDVGFLIGEYITETWDYTHLQDLIKNNGNLQVTLGMTSSEFQSAWFQFVKDKYGI